MRTSKLNLFGLGNSALLGLLACFLLTFSGGVVSGDAEGLDIEQIAERDLYGVLELEPDVSALDVKAAYRKLARKWHPDKNPADAEIAQDKFAEIAEAYEILSNETSRQLYDRARAWHAARRHHADSMKKPSRHDMKEKDPAGGARDEETSSAQWYHPYAQGMGEGDDFLMFGSTSFGDGGGLDAAAAAFGADPLFAEGGGRVFHFYPLDPMELFDSFFQSGGFDEREYRDHLEDHRRDQDPFQRLEEQGQQQHHYHHHHHQQQQQQQQQGERGGRQQQDSFSSYEGDYWQQELQGESPWAEWVGQDFERYRDYVHGGRKYRRVITTTVRRDGRSLSTAQDFVLDEETKTWTPTTDLFEYRGPRVGPWGPPFGEREGGRNPVDNVLRMNEYLRPGHSISSVDRKFTATLEHNCNFVLNYTGRGSPRHMTQVQVWETGSFDADGRCFVMIQDNGMLVVMSGDDPSAPGNVLWSNNRAYMGWFRQSSFHAYLLPNGNLVVAQGDSPMHPAANRCVWGAFGCPGDGGLQAWKLVWISLKAQADDMWCKVTRYHGYCEGDDDEYRAGYFKSKPGHGFDFHEAHDHPSSGKNRSQEQGRGSSCRHQEDGEAWHDKSKRKAVGVLNSGAEHVRRLVQDGFDKLKDTWEKIKAAAEETAHAASRPRHW